MRWMQRQVVEFIHYEIRRQEILFEQDVLRISPPDKRLTLIAAFSENLGFRLSMKRITMRNSVAWSKCCMTRTQVHKP